MSVALQRPRRGARNVDVKRSSAEEDVGNSIAFCLRTKGFCLVGDAFENDLLAKAQAEVDSLDDEGKLEQPNSLVQDGLLGPQGSAKIMELPETDVESDSQALGELDGVITSLLQVFAPYQQSAGLACTSRSNGVVHQSGDTCFGDCDLSDIDADKWSTVFARQKVCVLIFLGPAAGTLELVPYDDEAIPVEINTYAGLVIILRTDQLTFSYNSKETTAVLSGFFMQDNILRMHAAVRRAHMSPAAIALEEYISDRLQEIKSAETEGTVYGDDIPRNFIIAMNHQYHTAAMTAVPAVACRFPTTWDDNAFFQGVNCSGCDVVTSVPLTRWDHDTVYNPSEVCWQMQPAKTNCMHASFIDGVALFDAKMFGLSPAEVKGMDPNQRLVLESSYQALLAGGVPKKKMLNSSCGVYVGTSLGDWASAERSLDFGTFGATGGAASITAGRLSFCLGLKGACLSIDTEAAASMTATLLAAESVQLKGKGRLQEFALGIGTCLILAKTWWPVWSAAGLLCPMGRCFTFDDSASGFVKSEGSGTIMVRLLRQKVDGEEVETVEDDKPLGILAGGWSNHSGKTASLTAPNAASIEEALAESAKQVRIQALDVDAIELFGAANFMSDAVEACVARKAFRHNNIDETLVITGSKTQTGNGIEMSGLYQIIKALYATRRGLSAPTLHLRQLNPHIDFEDSAIAMSDERLCYRMSSCYQSIFARGFGGTNINLISFGEIDETIHAPPEVAEDFRPKLVYWPSGGGMLEFESRPRLGYFISGTWNDWANNERMEEEGDGVYGFTVTLDEKRWEQFFITLDGDVAKLLHPGRYRASEGTMVFGPDDFGDASRDHTWFIDGRTSYSAYELTDGTSEGAVAKQESTQEGTGDASVPGTQFRIRLHVAGKWQTVSWSKCGFKEIQSHGRYSLLTNVDEWSMSSAIEFEDRGGGIFRATVTQPSRSLQFVIIRNGDMCQAIYPLYTTASPDNVQVIGPDDLSDTFWQLQQSNYPAGIQVIIELEVSNGKSPVIRWSRAA